VEWSDKRDFLRPRLRISHACEYEPRRAHSRRRPGITAYRRYLPIMNSQMPPDTHRPAVTAGTDE
jgi:hypothetical protein